MKYLLILLLLMLAVGAEAKTCEECPPAMWDVLTDNGTVKRQGMGGGGNCGITVPAGDGCNTCSVEVWCVDGQWYESQGRICTLLGCYRPIILPGNPTE